MGLSDLDSPVNFKVDSTDVLRKGIDGLQVLVNLHLKRSFLDVTEGCLS